MEERRKWNPPEQGEQDHNTAVPFICLHTVVIVSSAIEAGNIVDMYLMPMRAIPELLHQARRCCALGHVQ